MNQTVCVAAEEAYAPKNLLEGYRKLLANGSEDIGFDRLWSYQFKPVNDLVSDRLSNLDDLRLSDMEKLGVDHQVVAPTSPGFELFEPAEARDLTMETNDLISQACKKYPQKFTGLAGIYLQDVE